MYFFSTNHPVNILRDETDKHTLVTFQDHGQYLNEGSEFLDDAIRMHEQPFMNMEVSVATESPEG